MRGEHQTITLPNPIRIDVTPPVIQDVGRTARHLAGRRPPEGRARVRYRLNEEGRGALFVNGRRRALTRFPRTEETIVWNGKVNGRAVRAGAYGLQLLAFDPAGNRRRGRL